MTVATWIARHPRLVIAAAVLMTAAALVGASRVRLRTDIVSLLPTGSPAATDYRVFQERVGGFEKVFVIVLDATPPSADAVDADAREETLATAAADLATILEASPLVASARSGMTPEDEAFFLDYLAPRAPLLLDHGWSEAVLSRIDPDAIHRRVAEIHARLLTPTGGFRSTLWRADPLGFVELLDGRGTRFAPAGFDPLSPAWLSPDGHAALVVVTPAGAEIEPATGHALAAVLDPAFSTVRSQLDAPLRFLAVGGPLYAAQDESIMREDLKRTVTGSVLACTVLLVLAFEGFLIPFAALAALAAALVWTAAWVGLVMGPISAVGVGFAAVLVGLGIDYGIHGGARFRDRLLALDDPVPALDTTFRHTGPGIVTSAVTTAVAFATLSLAHFRPLRELGQMVSAGIVFILVAAGTVGAALLVVSHRRRPARPGLLWRALGTAVEGVVTLATRRPLVTISAAVVVTGLAAVALTRLELDPSLTALRPANHPALEAEQLLVERFGVGLDTSTVVIPGADLHQALDRATAVERLLRDTLGDNAELATPTTWLAGGASSDRLAALAAMPLVHAADDLERELRAAGFNPAAFATGLAALRALGHGRDPGAPPPESWPDWLHELVRTDSDGIWLALRLRLAADVWTDGPPAELVRRVKELAPGSAFASAPALGAELRTLASKDLATLALVALVLVTTVVVASFRGHILHSCLASLPVVLGSAWALGFWSLAGLRLDLISLTVLPIMLGIGIDDGLHAVHGARSEPDGTVTAGVTSAARAMALTSLTTCAGFGSLALSRVPGLRSGGLLVSLGVLTCLAATLIVLPAVDTLLGRRR